MSKSPYILSLLLFILLGSLNLASANLCERLLNPKNSDNSSFSFSYFVNIDGSVDASLENTTNPNYIHLKDIALVESFNIALRSGNLDFLSKLSQNDIFLLNAGLNRYIENVPSPKAVPYYFKLLLAVTEFYMSEGNNLDHVEQAIRTIKTIPVVLQYRDYRVLYFRARFLIALESPETYIQAIRIANTLVGSNTRENLESALELSQILIRTNVGDNIDAGLDIRNRARLKLGL